MKIAFVADDEQALSAHFGRAPYAVVVTVEDGQEISRDVRKKEAHGGQHAHGEHDHDHGEHHHGNGHGHHHGDHGGKFAVMQDCDVMVVRGIGSPALEHAQRLGLEVYLTRESSIDAALRAYLNGTLDHDERRIHRH